MMTDEHAAGGCDKVLLVQAEFDGELDAAHAPAGLPFMANLGVDSDPCACVSGLVLSLEGNAITLSRRLWESGVQDAATSPIGQRSSACES